MVPAVSPTELEFVSEFYGLGLAIVLIAISVLVHFQALLVLSNWQSRLRATGHMKMVLIIFGLIAAHILETAVFAGGYWVGERGLNLGRFVGTRSMDVLDFFYFALETFTTQGLGDVYPIGPLRLVASLEPLVGLILIGWSASFTFLVMGREWRVGNLDD
jgi:hypothetical protein